MSDIKIYPVPSELAASAHIDAARYKAMYDRSIEDPEGFWAEQAARIDWTRPWDQVLDLSEAPATRWFRGGQLNTCWNALDRHVAAGRG
ncbi:MAG: acetyl-coenzyme A synthetase, partial [Gammaproteobacteria bacterium]|nr:acetyl-coenzyme A synthetase [Gammaproteobacteria bacterium]